MPSTSRESVHSQTSSEPAAADSLPAGEVASVFGHYATLTPFLHPEHGLGGQLLYVGNLDSSACHLLRAANIAGAASLAVSESPNELREALRSGAADFGVTSLDEALRILKNGIRLRRSVAVALSGAPIAIGEEMLARGVQPDLLPAEAEAIAPLCARAGFLAYGAQLLGSQENLPGAQFHAWAIPEPWMRHLAQLDALLLEALPAEDRAARRWLRLAPRYLGPRTRSLRSVCCTPEIAAKIQTILDASPAAS